MMLLALPLTGAACVGTVDNGGDTLEVGEDIVNGSFEPNYKFPWEVSINGCHGVLIDPSWVLTAAHCVESPTWSHRVTYTRTDPYDGLPHSDSRPVSVSGATFIHEGYVPGGGFSNPVNDIALIRVQTPFALDSYIQTVGIPSSPHVVGSTGAIASGSHNGTPPAGYEAVMRTQIPSTNPSTCAPPNGAFCISSTTASLCPGDSGSGFVTVENGRALVRGIASFMNASATCTSVQPTDYAVLTDVATYHDWILGKMGRNDTTLAGNTRVHTSGRVGRGVFGLGCDNPNGTQWGPMNVAGTQVGANCPAGDTQSVVCSLSPGQTDPIRLGTLAITGFSMKTTNLSTGATTTTALPVASSTAATYYGVLPAGVAREFTCSIGVNISIGGGGLGGVTSAF